MNLKSLPKTRRSARYALLTVLLSVALGSVRAQTEPARETALFTVVEQPPEFVGGMKAYESFMKSRVRQVKDTAQVKPTGKVFVSFTVTSQGIIEAARALNRPESTEAAEAVRLVQSMPPWNPGKQAGRPVNVRYNVVINFSER